MSDERIRRFITWKRGTAAAEARLKESNIPVWAIIQHLAALHGDVPAVAKDYEVTEAEVEAARAYYERHREVIDDRLAANVL